MRSRPRSSSENEAQNVPTIKCNTSKYGMGIIKESHFIFTDIRGGMTSLLFIFVTELTTFS